MRRQGGQDLCAKVGMAFQSALRRQVDDRRGIIANAEIGGFKKSDTLDPPEDERQHEDKLARRAPSRDDHGCSATRRREMPIEGIEPDRVPEGILTARFEKSAISC
ncbi:hypothetical protein [Aureimonas sp. SA4125]|uniref:hypothetical protein n=1 Tax=Aureimonas sp. SA4125 TaxID=2826993 RepID=UPI001CC59871|nr:hypothetical protein [Aureimonas sp. SA4125]